MLDKEQINKNKQDTIIRLSILMMIADRDIHDAEYYKVIEIIEKHSMYNISEDEITELVSEISFLREQKDLETIAFELASKLRSKESQKIAIGYLENIMKRDGYIHDAEKRYLKLVKKHWNL
tara:strand:- start:1197 stop:1562 length:366 start_codon:yes stop_codon:yes gene_type:complete